MTRDLAVLAARAVVGGLLVVAFALVGEVVRPKVFSGLFSAAPSVAIASLAITLVTEPVAKAHAASAGMVVGAVGMTACCVLAAVAVPRLKTMVGSLAAWAGWALVSFGLYWAVFVGAA